MLIRILSRDPAHVLFGGYYKELSISLSLRCTTPHLPGSSFVSHSSLLPTKGVNFVVGT